MKRTGRSLIDPERYALQNFFSHRLARHCGSKELPVRLRVHVPTIKGQSISLTHSMIPITLDLIHPPRDETGLVTLILFWMARR